MNIFYSVAGILALVGGWLYYQRYILPGQKTRKNLSQLYGEAPTLSVDGFIFRDLNKNGQLDPYEDSRLPIETRVEDLLQRMTLEEKAGMMFHTMLEINKDGSLEEKGAMLAALPSASDMIARRLMNHFNLMNGIEPRKMAEWHNGIQKMAERTRLGIPVTFSTDPRHSFNQTLGANISAGFFSAWPEPLGLAAMRDADMVRKFGDIARQEYVATGIRVALHPMADLATEPRWCRINGTFGEDAHLSAETTAAYVRGFQGETLGRDSVACMTKHFPGGGPQKDGEDPHFSYGKDQVYPGNNFDYHLVPFVAAFEAKTAQIMPYYGRPLGLEYEEVGFGFNKSVITGLLREKYGFAGVICTDWMLLNGISLFGRQLIEAKAWGVEHLSVPERAQKAIEAGVDQFGGEYCPEVIIGLVRDGKVSEERISQSIRRLLREKFRLGLFDQPYLDPAYAEKVVGSPEFVAAGVEAQRKSIILLKNDGRLPLKTSLKLYTEGVEREIAAQYGQVVATPAEADIALLRLNAPYEPRKGFLERIFHAGDLDFKYPEKERILAILDQVPTIVDIYLERPSVIPEIAEKCAGLLANFGANDSVVMDVIFGKFAPTGKLPMELPRSMDAVRAQKSDVPFDSENPLYPFGHGLTY